MTGGSRGWASHLKTLKEGLHHGAGEIQNMNRRDLESHPGKWNSKGDVRAERA